MGRNLSKFADNNRASSTAEVQADDNSCPFSDKIWKLNPTNFDELGDETNVIFLSKPHVEENIYTISSSDSE